jgi:hypothetical protein
MGERALKFAVGRELGMDVTSSLAVLADRKSKFLICVKLTSFLFEITKSWFDVIESRSFSTSSLNALAASKTLRTFRRFLLRVLRGLQRR